MSVNEPISPGKMFIKSPGDAVRLSDSTHMTASRHELLHKRQPPFNVSCLHNVRACISYCLPFLVYVLSCPVMILFLCTDAVSLAVESCHHRLPHTREPTASAHIKRSLPPRLLNSTNHGLRRWG